MRNLIFLLITLQILLSSCQTVKQNTIAFNKENVNQFLDSWHKAASEANYNNYFDAMDKVSVFVGTDAGEVWSKKQFQDFSKPFFDKGKAWSFKKIERNIYTEKGTNFIWFDEILDTWMGVCRGSGVLKQIGNKFVIKHYVLSITIPNEIVNDVIPLKKDKEAKYLDK
ncbi:nuclear transport factor 2 family protein [uncultured Tenacibaculum sp.]|uniref:nuclear transport factor 2 family protein n=1 Tax=uncultured Tenacibaculum sp. TaxID=174713 RepID=UPI0026116A3A|nr:nuclear transport factor 2 family protein [uncultured Tenacibaculum sp.]